MDASCLSEIAYAVAFGFGALVYKVFGGGVPRPPVAVVANDGGWDFDGISYGDGCFDNAHSLFN